MAYKKLFIILLLFSGLHLHADRFHNINGFYGPRAPGLAGAYTAISDDPSGAFYNPAGLAFSQNSGVSISGTSYKSKNKVFKDILGYGQNYIRTSESFNPNFIGGLVKMDEWTFAFSLLNTLSEEYDQGDQIYYPRNIPYISNLRIEYLENNSQYLFGPSVAYRISPKLSMGATLCIEQQ